MSARLKALWSRCVAFERRIRWASVAAALPTIAGALLDPIAGNIVPPSWSRALIVTGSVLQMFCHYVLHAPEAS